MAFFADTCHESEGSNPLKQLFDTNKKLNIKWYHQLIEEDIDWDDLIKSSEKNVTEMLKDDCQFKGKAILRIINAISEITESRIYKDLNDVKVSVISTEESNAIKDIQETSTRINEVITNITNILQSLNINSKLSENDINNNCDELINIINQRREELLTKLKRIAELKHNKLLNQQNNLTQQAQIFADFYEKMQHLIKDTRMDFEKRKIKILSQTKQILNTFKQNENDLIFVTNDKINIKMNINKISHLLSTIGEIYDGNGALPPLIQIKKVTYNAAIISIKNNDDEKECIGYQLQYVSSNNNNNNNNNINIDDEKLNWISVNIKEKNIVQYEIKGLNKSTQYLVRAAAKNENGFGAFCRYEKFITKDISPIQLISSEMIFDSFGMNTLRMQIVNPRTVKCLKGYQVAYKESCWGSSIRFKYGMPISIRGNNKDNIASISWQITHTATHCFPNSSYFIGVVSNRNTDFSNIANQGLKDAYGISGLKTYIYKEGKRVTDSNYKSYPQNATIKIEYKINESKLLFSYGNGTKLYEMTLPTNINKITHWYPCISLRDKDDICKILENVNVKQ